MQDKKHMRQIEARDRRSADSSQPIYSAARAASTAQWHAAAALVATSPRMDAQRRTAEMTNTGARASAQARFADTGSAQAVRPLSKTNATGLPDHLKSGIETLSGMAMDHVKVHYNSAQPARLAAHAYAQGSEIHVAPGQERHLPHEAWHVVQQAQGRVRPTMQMMGQVPVNDDEGLEHEADVMGNKALQLQVSDLPLSKPGPVGNVAQLGGRKKKRRTQASKSQPRRKKGISTPDQQMEKDASDSGDPDVTHYVMADEGKEPGYYEETYESPRLFWRGDSRGPSEVFLTGFTTSNERNNPSTAGKNRIIWRAGGATDDILPASAVCLAKDVRGSAFFPLTGESQFYMYAVCKSTVVSTFRAQQDAERAQTGVSNFKRPERYRYDPAYAHDEQASAVWQFQEFAAHRVEDTEILGCFKVERRTLVPPVGDESVAIAGIQFRLEFFKAADFGGRRDWKVQKKVLAEAKTIAAQYETFYPQEQKFLSYMGIVQPRDIFNPPETLDEAPRKVRQIDAVVTQGAFIEPGRPSASP